MLCFLSTNQALKQLQTDPFEPGCTIPTLQKWELAGEVMRVARALEFTAELEYQVSGLQPVASSNSLPQATSSPQRKSDLVLALGKITVWAECL